MLCVAGDAYMAPVILVGGGIAAAVRDCHGGRSRFTLDACGAGIVVPCDTAGITFRILLSRTVA